MEDYKRISSKPSNSQSLSCTGLSSSAANCDLSKPCTQRISNLINLPSKKFGNEDEERSTIDLKSREYLRNQDEESPKACQTNEDPVEKSVSLTLARVEDFENISSIPSNTVEHSESLKRKHACMSQESRSSLVTDLNKLHGPNARFNTEYLTVHDRVALKDDSLVESRIGSVEEVSSKGKTESYLRPSLGDENRFPNGIGKGSERCEENCGVIRVGTLNRHEDLSDTTMVDSISAVDISPDGVIGVLGEKQFCKTRNAIVNQQRVFAVQVFELHRLIKVQRLIAGSPDLFLEGNPLMRKPAMKVSVVTKAPEEQAQEPSRTIVKPKHHPQKPYSTTECAEESTVGKFHLPFVNNDTSSRGPQQSHHGQYSKKSSPASEAIDSKPSPWRFQPPPGNLWLVPVMSPSEGLTYKPYTGPCPPIGGFMAPMYGSCGPVSLNPGNKSYLNAVYGVPASYQQGIGISTPPLLQTYFPPYAPSVMNPSSHENQMREVMSCCMGNIRAPVEGSTPSSPSDRTNCNVLPLFPMAPQVEEPAQNVQTSEHQTRAIKVIPRSFRSATESAARLFLSIQEGRK